MQLLARNILADRVLKHAQRPALQTEHFYSARRHVVSRLRIGESRNQNAHHDGKRAAGSRHNAKKWKCPANDDSTAIRFRKLFSTAWPRSGTELSCTSRTTSPDVEPECLSNCQRPTNRLGCGRLLALRTLRNLPHRRPPAMTQMSHTPPPVTHPQPHPAPNPPHSHPYHRLSYRDPHQHSPPKHTRHATTTAPTAPHNNTPLHRCIHPAVPPSPPHPTPDYRGSFARCNNTIPVNTNPANTVGVSKVGTTTNATTATNHTNST